MQNSWEQVSSENCRDVSIHLPGQIQPHGALVACDMHDLRVHLASANVHETLQLDDPNVLGKPLATLLPESAMEQLSRIMADAGELGPNPFRIQFEPAHLGAHFDGLLHRSGDWLLLEIEPLPDEFATELAYKSVQIGRALKKIGEKSGVAAICEESVHAAKEILQFDRVMVYRFDADGHGTVIAEAVNPGLESYVDHRFPESDIPPPARALYRKFHSRIIPDTFAVPIDLVSDGQGPPPNTLDLSMAGLRAVSPIHLEYMQNMHVHATFVMSIIVRGALWGMISCHQLEKRTLPYEFRVLMEIYADTVARQIEAAEEKRIHSALEKALRFSETRLRDIPDDEDFCAIIQAHVEEFLAPVGATGAAILFDGEVTRLGKAPGESQVTELARWLRTQLMEGAYTTHELPRIYPEATAFKESASGIIAYALDQKMDDLVMWFRPETPTPELWLGDPEITVWRDLETGALHPRNSFDTWRTVVRDAAAPWALEDTRAAQELRATVVGAAAEAKRAQARKTKAELQKKMQHAQQMKSLGVLAAGMAHDFNNLLTAILGRTELALHDLNPESPARVHLQSIKKTSQSAAEQCNQLLAYSGKGKFVVEPIDLTLLIEEMNHLLSISVGRNVTLNYGLHQDIYAVEADAQQFQQVTLNLVMNAADAIGDYSGTITINTGEIACDAPYLAANFPLSNLSPGTYVYLEVSDTGAGMSESTRKRVFEPFFSTRAVGRGLGLAAVMGIVEGHHGGIAVQSTAGTGSTFRAILPALPQKIRRTRHDIPRDTGEQQYDGTVLLVDDEVAIRDTTGLMLRRMGFEVETASNGLEGTKKFETLQDRLKFVLMDITMPVMDGLTAQKKMHELHPDTPILLTSGFSEENVLTVDSDDGAVRFLQKPYTYKTLNTAIADVIAAGESG